MSYILDFIFIMQGYKVYVIEDAVESLYSAQKLVASEDMQNKGVVVCVWVGVVVCVRG